MQVMATIRLLVALVATASSVGTVLTRSISVRTVIPSMYRQTLTAVLLQMAWVEQIQHSVLRTLSAAKVMTLLLVHRVQTEFRRVMVTIQLMPARAQTPLKPGQVTIESYTTKQPLLTAVLGTMTSWLFKMLRLHSAMTREQSATLKSLTLKQ